MTSTRLAAPHFAPVIPRGTVSYGLGFLAFLPLPVVSMLIGAIAMIALYPHQRRRGGLASENGRHAANWGLTVLSAMFVLGAGFATLLIATGSTSRIAPLLATLGYVGLSLVHVSVLIIGVFRTISGRIFDNPLAIPFIRTQSLY